MKTSRASFKQRLWRAWRSSWFWPERLEKYLIYKSLSDVKGWANGDLLDIGCGKKPYVSLFAGQVTRHIGVDYPPALVTSGQTAQGGPDVFADVALLPFCDNCFHTVLCTQVLEHVPEPWRALEAVARVLKPGGVLIMTAPQEWGTHRAPYDFYRFTRYGLAYLVQRSGLHVEHLCARGGFWVMLAQRTSGYLNDAFLRPLHSRHKLLFLVGAGFLLPLCALVQLLGLAFDRIQHLEANTLGYLIVARKPEGARNL